MKDTLIKNLHIFILIYTAFINYDLYEVKIVEIEAQKATIASTQARLARSKTELAKVDQFNKDLESSKQRVAEVVAEIEKVRKQLPSEINDIEVQQLLSGISQDLRMREPSTSPNTETSNDFYFTKDYTFSVKATFLQALIFFEKLENISKSNRILNVKYFKMSDDPESDNRSQFRGLKIETNLESYRYNTNYKIDTITEVPAGQIKKVKQ